MVELLARYSNRPELLGPLEAVHRRLHAAPADGPVAEPAVAVVHDRERSVQRLRLVDRLTEAQITALIADYHAGATLHEVAARYGFGTTAIKRLLRRRGARRSDKPKH